MLNNSLPSTPTAWGKDIPKILSYRKLMELCTEKGQKSIISECIEQPNENSGENCYTWVITVKTTDLWSIAFTEDKEP